MAKANDRQVAGNHYSKQGNSLQHWDMVDQFNLDYFQGQITKYVMRWRDKGGITDLEKARHFLDKYIELETAKKEKKELEKVINGAISTENLLSIPVVHYMEYGIDVYTTACGKNREGKTTAGVKETINCLECKRVIEVRSQSERDYHDGAHEGVK